MALRILDEQLRAYDELIKLMNQRVDELFSVFEGRVELRALFPESPAAGLTPWSMQHAHIADARVLDAVSAFDAAARDYHRSEALNEVMDPALGRHVEAFYAVEHARLAVIDAIRAALFVDPLGDVRAALFESPKRVESNDQAKAKTGS